MLVGSLDSRCRRLQWRGNLAWNDCRSVSGAASLQMGERARNRLAKEEVQALSASIYSRIMGTTGLAAWQLQTSDRAHTRAFHYNDALADCRAQYFFLEAFFQISR